MRAANPTRTARATILWFSSTGEYVQHSCYVIENPDTSLTISAGDGHAVAIGRWKVRSRGIEVTRIRVARSAKVSGAQVDPLCSPRDTRYQPALGGVVLGHDVYVTTRLLVSPDWNGYIQDARLSGIACGGA